MFIAHSYVSNELSPSVVVILPSYSFLSFVLTEQTNYRLNVCMSTFSPPLTSFELFVSTQTSPLTFVFKIMSSMNGTNALRVNVVLSERDAVKLILDFFQRRELYISMLDIERETGRLQKAIRSLFISGFTHLTTMSGLFLFF